MYCKKCVTKYYNDNNNGKVLNSNTSKNQTYTKKEK